ncbi:MAG: MFS transporter [Propionibacterium sp.]
MTPPASSGEAGAPTPTPGGHRRLWAAVPFAALLCFCLILRAPVTVVPPLLVQIRADLGLSAVTAGLLTSIPVLCFGLLTPAASRLMRSTGVNHGALYGVGAVIAGSVLRSVGGVDTAFAGTILIGAGITIGNLVVPMLIGRDFRQRTELATGVYSATVNIAVAVSTALAAPVGLVIGWRLTAALIGTALGGLALAVWLSVYPPGIRGPRASIRRRAGLAELPPAPGRSGRARSGTRRSMRGLIVLTTLSFCGHTLAYYAVTAWLPTALMEIRAMSQSQAGAAASVFQAAGIAGPLLVPFFSGALRWTPRRIVVVIGAAWVTMPAGMLLAPQLWLVWSILAGMAQGGYFTVLMAVLIRRSRNVDENRHATAVVQSVGYCVAATGPVILGWVHEHISGWNGPFALILVVVVAMVIIGASAVREGRGLGD